MRILSIWASCKAVGIDLSPRIYYVMGPLFFLVLLVPFTLNGFAVREAFFVSFLGSVGVERRRGLRGRLPLLPRHGRARRCRAAAILLWESVRGGAAPRGRSMADAGDAGVVVTTHNALPWIEQCLASVEGVETVVVDNDSSDGTVAFVRERFPAVTVIEQANRGLAAGWARGLEERPRAAGR